MLDASIGSLNVAVRMKLVDWPVALCVGLVAVTVGGVVAPDGGTSVTDDETNADASALPAASVAPVLTPTIYVAPAASAADGVKVASFDAEPYATPPGTAAPPERTNVTVLL